MRKGWIILAGLALIIFALMGCGKKQESGQTPALPANTAQTTPAVQTAAVVYYCPMDTDVVSDKPGKCPKCGMDLVEKKADIR